MAPPKWRGDIYAGDHETLSIRRAQANQRVSCIDPEFNDYICMTGESFRSFVDTYVIGCVKWKKGGETMTLAEAETLYKLYRVVEDGEYIVEPTQDTRLDNSEHRDYSDKR